MTIRECAIVMAYTGACMLSGDKLRHYYKYVEELLGEPVWIHEFYTRADEIKEKARPDFLRLCAETREEALDMNHITIRLPHDSSMEFMRGALYVIDELTDIQKGCRSVSNSKI